MSRVQFFRRKATFPVPVLADMVSKATCVTDFFFQIRTWRLDSVTALQIYLVQLNPTHLFSSSKGRKKEKYYHIPLPSLWFPNYREESDIAEDIIF